MEELSTRVVLATDGATGNSNPGPITIGGVLIPHKFDGYIPHLKILGCFHESMKATGTNNEAEYHALIRGLELAAELGYKEVRCFVDSQLIAKQITGEYACKKDNLKPLHRQVVSLMKSAFDYVSITWHPRGDQLAELADKLSKTDTHVVFQGAMKHIPFKEYEKRGKNDQIAF